MVGRTKVVGLRITADDYTAWQNLARVTECRNLSHFLERMIRRGIETLELPVAERNVQDARRKRSAA